MKPLAGLILFASFGLILAQLPAQEVPLEPGKKPVVEGQKDKDKDKAPEKKIEVKPRPLIGNAELKDGTTLTCEFLKPAEISIQVSELALITVPLEKCRLIDFQGNRQRVSTYGGDTFQGAIVTSAFPIKIGVSMGTIELELKQELINRMTFNEPLPVLVAPAEEVKTGMDKTAKDKDAKDKDKDKK